MSMKTFPSSSTITNTVDVKSNVPRDSIFRQFANSTTLHGFRNACDGPKVRRLVWVIFLIGSTAAFLTAAIALFCSYLSYDVVTRIFFVNQDDAVFPAVTFCNFNRFRKEYLQNMNLTDVASYERILHGDQKLIWPYDDERSNISIEKVVREGGHRLEDMLISCRFLGENCSLNFEPIITRMGLCYTFSPDSENSSLARIQAPGEDFGLAVVLTVQQDQYYGVESDIAGLKVLVHRQNEPPLVKEYGFAVMPGTCTYVATTKKEVKLLPAPFKTKCRNKKLPGMKSYSKNLCFEECRMKYIIKKCGCRDAYMTVFPDIRYCTLKELFDCIIPNQETYSPVSERNCICPEPCELISYEIRLSYAQFPSEHTKQKLAPHLARYITNEKNQSLVDYLGKNVVQIKVFFRDLNYNIIEDVPKVTWQSLFAEVGGLLGLLLGASILTILEFLEFMLSPLFRNVLNN